MLREELHRRRVALGLVVKIRLQINPVILTAEQVHPDVTPALVMAQKNRGARGKRANIIGPGSPASSRLSWLIVLAVARRLFFPRWPVLPGGVGRTRPQPVWAAEEMAALCSAEEPQALARQPVKVAVGSRV